MEDVASRAGVSRALVSIVFRDMPGASDATRQRVRDAARAIGYAPDQRARLLSRRHSGLIGVQFGVEHSFHGEVVEALYAAAAGSGYDVALSAVAPSRSEAEAVDSLLAYRCEALILLGPAVPAGQLDALGSRVPLVVVARNLRTKAIDVVRTDDVDGAEQATRHLIELGHRRIAHIDGGTAPGAAERRRGYRRAMQRGGLGDHLRIVTGGLTESAGADAGSQLVRSGTRRSQPTAVFAFNDRCAIGVIHAAGQAGWDVPGDLSVVGFDDSRVATLPWVDLTTVRQDVDRIATDAVRQAVSRVQAEPPTSTIVPPRLIIRTSTAVRAPTDG